MPAHNPNRKTYLHPTKYIQI